MTRETQVRAAPGTGRRRSTAAVITASVGLALVVNQLVYYAGRAAGGRFTFASAGQTMEVDAATVAAFTVLPLLAGLLLMAVVGRRRPALLRAAMIGAPALAIVTIAIMTLPAGFDTTSTLTLAMCHVTLAPISVAGLVALGRRT